MDLYCPCGMCESNRRAMGWDRPMRDARDVGVSEDIRRLMRERPLRIDLGRKVVNPKVVTDTEATMRRVMDKWLRGS